MILEVLELYVEGVRYSHSWRMGVVCHGSGGLDWISHWRPSYLVWDYASVSHVKIPQKMVSSFLKEEEVAICIG